MLRERWRLGAFLVTALRHADAPIGLLLVGVDDCDPDAMTERLVVGVAAQTALALENARLLEDLRAASALKTEFMATMSHELRSPLNAILGYVEILHDEDGEPGRATREGRCALLDRVAMHSRELLDMIVATLDVGRLESGRLPVALAPVELAALVEEMQAVVPEYWRKASVTLEWKAGEGPTVETDGEKVKTIVYNLVHNALKFTDRGRVEVRIGIAAAEHADVEPRCARLEVVVTDSGVGIAPERQAVMFEMFRQGDASDTRRHGGVGLGLYVVQRLVHALDGAVRVDSAEGVGSTFTITLPVRIAGAARERGPAAVGMSPVLRDDASSSDRRRRVLRGANANRPAGH
jgi:two-component system capsular synthesis sensor histidine kinase RcsC